MSTEELKQKVGFAAAELVEDRMIVGLGTGSTAYFFIEHLIERTKKGLSISVVASSQKSLSQAKAGGLTVIDIETITSIDLTIDGADEIDPKKQMIKGGGGALLREKIVASMSKEMIVIVDESKCVPSLGTHKLPLEIVPFAHLSTKHKLSLLGYSGSFRTANNQLFVTDNNNYILDIQLDPATIDPRKDHEAMLRIPGVVETGFFFDLAGRVIIGYKDGNVEIKC